METKNTVTAATTPEGLRALIAQVLNERKERGTLDSHLSGDEIVDHAYMLTQYANAGIVGQDELTNYVLNEVMEEPTIDQINEYLEANSYEIYYELTDYMVDEVLNGLSPSEIVRMATYGSFNWNDDYFQYNGYGNLESCAEWEIKDDYGKETKAYLMEQGEVDYDAQCVLDDGEIIIAACNALLFDSAEIF